ncbi:hypothetical protein LIER_34580 [Lithospermum erythrorhizon]|uniref:BZIP domain-containing protein n=1 Tax=Lithospermum erythrorhizon TaxID=34254 RepID=A0AAV3S3F4_LITER
MYGEDKDPLQYPLMKSLWTSIDPVKAGLAKGRVFGAGGGAKRRRRGGDRQKKRNRALSKELVADKMSNEELTKKVSTVEADLARLSAYVILPSLAARTLAVEILPSLAASLPSTGSSTSTGLLAQTEMMHTPA